MSPEEEQSLIDQYGEDRAMIILNWIAARDWYSRLEVAGLATPADKTTLAECQRRAARARGEEE